MNRGLPATVGVVALYCDERSERLQAWRLRATIPFQIAAPTNTSPSTRLFWATVEFYTRFWVEQAAFVVRSLWYFDGRSDRY